MRCEEDGTLRWGRTGVRGRMSWSVGRTVRSEHTLVVNRRESIRSGKSSIAYNNTEANDWSVTSEAKFYPLTQIPSCSVCCYVPFSTALLKFLLPVKWGP